MIKKFFTYSLMTTAILYSALSEAQNTSTFPQPAEVSSEEELRVHVGLNAGIASPEGGYKSTPEYGLDVGYQPYIPFGLGAELFTSRIETDNSDEMDRTTLLLRGTYNFGGTIPVLRSSYVGLGAGPVFRNDGTDLGVAPLVGFDIPLKESNRYFLSLGLTAKYLIIEGSNPDTFSASGVVKYWY